MVEATVPVNESHFVIASLAVYGSRTREKLEWRIKPVGGERSLARSCLERLPSQLLVAFAPSH
jgi:hypothetical protein